MSTPGRTSLDRLAARSRLLVVLSLGTLTFAMHLAVMGRRPTEWDSALYALGVVGTFDVRQESPHAPGYYLYVLAGRLVHWLLPLDANHSLVVVTALASAGIVVVTYLVGKRLGGTWFGIGAAALTATSPFVWFYSSMASTYGFDALVSIILVLLVLRARSPGGREALIGAVVLGLGIGLRPSVAILVAPLALLLALRSIRGWRMALQSASAGAAAVAVWFVPMVMEQPEGFGILRSTTDDMWTAAASATSLIAGSPEGWTNLERMLATVVVGAGPALAVGVTALLAARFHPANKRIRLAGPDRMEAAWVLALAALPPLLFLGLTHFPKPGYVLVSLPALVLLLLLPAAGVAGATRVLVVVLMAVMALGGSQRFLFAPGVLPLTSDRLWITQERLWAPFQQTRSGIRGADYSAERYQRLHGVVDPGREVLVFDAQRGGVHYAYARYALPEYRAIRTEGGTVWRRAWRRQQRSLQEQEIVVPPGGSAVLLMDPPATVDDLVAEGGIPLDIPGGLVAVRVIPGGTLLGLPVVEGRWGPSP